MKEKMNIVKRESAKKYLNDVISHADQNKASFGFLSQSAYHESLEKGNLWVLLVESNYAGHLLFGGRYPSLKVFQLYISESYQKQGCGRFFFNNLIVYAKKEQYQSISAKVATELPATFFWEKMGFQLVDQEEGRGKSRLINKYIFEVDENQLFDNGGKPKISNFSELMINDKTPISTVPIYSIDLNVFFDYVKSRENEKYVSYLISMAMSGHIRLVVTREFTKELERHSKGDDPILRFAEQIKRLPELDYKKNKQLIDEIYQLIFPEKKKKTKLNDKSDVIHIVTSIYSQVDGFITSEKKILKQAQTIYRDFGIEILSPYELYSDGSLTEYNSVASSANEISIISLNQIASIKSLPAAFNNFMSGRTQAEVLLFDFENLYQINIGNESVGCLGVQKVSKKVQTINSLIIINEDAKEIYSIIDFCLDKLFKHTENKEYSIINLKVKKDAEMLIEEVKKRGFVRTKSKNLSFIENKKIYVNKIIRKEDWHYFGGLLNDFLGIKAGPHFPNYDEINKSGILVKDLDNNKYKMNLFDFELFFSPSILMCKGRPAVIIPIQKDYAEAFYPVLTLQKELFPSGIVSMSNEKAYFRYPRRMKSLERGMLAFFYVSQKKGGSMSIIGYGRITFSQILDIKNLNERFYRQGVLSEGGILQRSEKEKIHVITFSNFSLFNYPVKYDLLKEKRMISGANMVTAESIDYITAKFILKTGNSGV